MQIIDIEQNPIRIRPPSDERLSADEPMSKPCSEVCVDFGEFDRRTPSSIERAFYGAKPRVTFEMFVERGSSLFTSSWLCY